MLIGQATLKSAAFCPRLTMLIEDLQNAGYTVWLEGMSVRFDHESAQEAASPPTVLNELIGRYGDVVEWVPWEAAMTRLTYPHDRQTLAEARPLRRRTHALVVLRHAKARSRGDWRKDDRLRPLVELGEAQASGL